MPFNGSGTFSRLYNWVVEQASSPIEISKLDADCDDIATGLSNCILRDGTGLPSTTIPWNSQSLTGVANLSAERVTVTGSTVPANGMYLSAANTVAWASNTTLRGSVNSTGNWVFAAPSSGVGLVVGGLTGTRTMYLDSTGAGNALNFGWNLGLVGSAWNLYTASTDPLAIGTTGAGALSLYTNSLGRVTVGSAGNVTINAPSSGVGLAVNGLAGATTATIQDSAIPKLGFLVGATERAFLSYTEATFTTRLDSDGPLVLAANNTAALSIASAGNVTIAVPSSGTALAVTSISGTYAYRATDGTVDGGLYTDGASGLRVSTQGAHAVHVYTNATQRLSVGSAGNVTINAASSGTELTVTGEVAATTFVGALTGDVTGNVSGSSGSCTGNAATATALQTARTINGTSFNGTANITVTAAADTLTGTTLAALSGANLTALNATQLTSGTVPSARITSVDASATINSFTIGYRQIPLSATTSGSLPTSDVGKMVAATAGVTIPNSTFSAGDAVSIVNDSASAITITASITTLYWTQTGGTGNRTLAARGSCTVWFKSGTVAYISGAGLS